MSGWVRLSSGATSCTEYGDVKSWENSITTLQAMYFTSQWLKRFSRRPSQRVDAVKDLTRYSPYIMVIPFGAHANRAQSRVHTTVHAFLSCVCIPIDQFQTAPCIPNKYVLDKNYIRYDRT